jgi:predicted hotdog family 3-hydroxylacyl-ACP dehydratase
MHPWVPQRAPMLLLDAVLEMTAERGATTARVDPEACYADAGGNMPAWYGLELMAQTVAAYQGWRLAGIGGAGGYLVGIRSFRSTRPHFPAQALLEVRARLLEEDPSGLAGFACEILLDGSLAASAILKVIRT